MDIKRFQEIATALLKKHYGLELNDTQLCDDSIVAQCIEQGRRPYQAIAEYADEADLHRVDKAADFSTQFNASITVVDEENVIQNLPIPSIQFATHMNDYVKAMSLYEAFTSSGICHRNLDETMAMYKPSRRAENWFLKMLENGRGYLTEEEQALILNDRYGDSIIGERPSEYDSIEIQGVRDKNLPNSPEGTFCEVDNVNPQFFSVYAHLKEGGVECVGDFATHALAEAYAKELAAKYDWSVNDFVPERLI